MANRRSFVRSAPKRAMHWEGANVSHNVGTGAAVMSSIVSEANLENTPVPTIVRVRGYMLIHLVSSAAEPMTMNFYMGIKLATVTAFGVGIGSIEKPFDDLGSDWLWWDVRTLNVFDGTLTTNDQSMTQVRVPVDSKAMRVAKTNKVLIFVSQNQAITSTATVQVNGAVRVLVKD